MAPVALFANVGGQIIVVEPVGNDDDATGPRVIKARHDQAVETLIDEFDLFDVAGILKIKWVIKNDDVSAAPGEGPPTEVANTPPPCVVAKSLTLERSSATRVLKTFLYHGDCKTRRI
jgi:hypothetical protein